MMYPCPCCGYLVFAEPPGSYDICPICFWEDDLLQLCFPEKLGANNVSLLQAQKNFAAAGSSEDRVRKLVRSPAAGEMRDPLWRPIEPERDRFETQISNAGPDYPDDLTELYYWRK